MLSFPPAAVNSNTENITFSMDVTHIEEVMGKHEEELWKDRVAAFKK